jgi:glycosyl transferase family 1
MAMRFLLDPPRERAVEWDPHDPPADLRADVRYWSDAFRELPREGDLTVVLTWSIAELPVEGPDVVPVVLGDEGSRRPAYAPRIGALFKCYGERPRFSRPSASTLGLSILLQELRRWAEALRDPRGGPPAHPIPLGLVRPIDVAVRPMSERDLEVAFMGSVEEDHRRLRRAKSISRSTMLEAVPAGAHIRTTGSFGASLEADAAAYAEELGRTKVLLAPRGGSVETFRFYEGMLAGCVVVTEPLPPFWFYEGSPAVVVRDWRSLPDVLDRLLRDPEGLRRRQDAALRWWDERLSPRAVGRYMARCLQGPNGPAGGAGASRAR